jgi:hypothetical protein
LSAVRAIKETATWKFECQLATSGVAVEKLDIHKNGMILGDGKWSVTPYKSFMGHPDATLFWTSSHI